MLALVIGGAASGKSEVAEAAAARLAGDRGARGDVVYLATMVDDGTPAAAARIARHEALRAGRGFVVREAARDLDARLAGDASLAGAVVLLEGLGTLVANEMFADVAAPRPAREVADAVSRQVAWLAARAGSLVVVSDDVMASGERPVDAATRAYVEALAAVNLRVARAADAVTEVVCGIVVARKGAMPHARA
ncbi:bifunctional adenosylcobinamide kinase/adenosylcobinamide-phosphate guanylyltransferase [bacterium]|nr:bifunctional adenosylcobinamide kinase/adenosylcobinamide-phosphate guanylyltransferase [bacterium]